MAAEAGRGASDGGLDSARGRSGRGLRRDAEWPLADDFIDLSCPASLHSATVPRAARVRGLCWVRAHAEADMLGEGEGLELLGVFFTFMLGLTVMVVLGKWWEA